MKQLRVDINIFNYICTGWIQDALQENENIQRAGNLPQKIAFGSHLSSQCS